MKSPEKLAVFLETAARGRNPDVPKELRRILRIVVATGALEKIRTAAPEDVDKMLEGVADLALSMRSDDRQETLIASGRALLWSEVVENRASDQDGRAESDGEPLEETPEGDGPEESAP